VCVVAGREKELCRKCKGSKWGKSLRACVGAREVKLTLLNCPNFLPFNALCYIALVNEAYDRTHRSLSGPKKNVGSAQGMFFDVELHLISR
jgi:hypothetical protein